MQSRRVTGVAALPIVGVVFLSLGLVALAGAGVLVALELASGRSLHAEGVVIAEGYGRPRVRFTAQDGRTAEFREPVRNTSWNVGDRTTVAYDPQRPTEGRIDGISGRWFLPFLAGILGGVFTLVGAGLAIAGRLAMRASV